MWFDDGHLTFLLRFIIIIIFNTKYIALQAYRYNSLLDILILYVNSVLLAS